MLRGEQRGTEKALAFFPSKVGDEAPQSEGHNNNANDGDGNDGDSD